MAVKQAKCALMAPQSSRVPPVRCTNSSTDIITNKRTKQSFPAYLPNVQAAPMRCLGTGFRATPMRFLPLIDRSRTAVALYADPTAIASQLTARARKGVSDDLANLLLDTNAHKMLAFKCNKRTSPDDIITELSGPILYRARLTGGKTEAVDGLQTLYQQLGIDMLQPGDSFVILHRLDQALLVGGPSQCAGGDELPLQFHEPVKGAGLARGVFEAVLGEKSVLPEAKAEWLKGVEQLLAESDHEGVLR